METDKPYDLTTIHAISDNNPEFLNQLLIVFTDTVSKDINTLKQAADNNNWTEVGQVAHKIKPSLSHFGVTSLTDTIRGLEHNSGGDPQNLRLLVDKIVAVMEQVIAGLKHEFPDVFN
jgi:HPt (histidine-containing phosphotransfer) domain-containing protein